MVGSESRAIAGTRVLARWTDRTDGDQRSLCETTNAIRELTGGRSVYRPNQVHGSHVLVVDAARQKSWDEGLSTRGPTGGSIGSAGSTDSTGAAGLPLVRPWMRNSDGSLPIGDAVLITGSDGAAAVLTADCASIALASREGIAAAVHAGWRGLVDGVIDQAVEAIRSHGGSDVFAALGPCIHACCYEFSADGLDSVVAALSPSVRGVSSTGNPAMNLPAGVAFAIERAGAIPVVGIDACTGCDSRWYSHRVRQDAERQALMVWSEGGM